ncbi:MAG: T9SS type A sorting domain-containing protein [Rhodothermaceae bacterium]|nr:T9SS type A sorting domain-containing protein [Rhodothermaceae bacterium]
MRILFSPVSLFRLFICLAWFSMLSFPAVGQNVLRSEHNGMCKSLIEEACEAGNKKARKAPLALTRQSDEALQLRKQRHFEERLVKRYAERAEAKRSSRPAGKTSTFSGAVNEQDSLALVAVFNELDGANWTDNTGWLEGPVTSWVGVLVDDAGRVIELDLNFNELFGFLPSELGDLSELLLLDFNDNFLLGQIPTELGNLSNIEVLDLGFNILGGEIPASFANLTNLFDLVLWGNNLTGQIPTFIANFPNLETLSLEFNQLEGPIPTFLGQLINLRELYLDQNQLSGPIPPELGNLTNLLSVFLGDNDLSGSIPTELFSIEGLLVLSIPDAGFSGSVPTEVANLTELTYLDLGENSFGGEFPDEVQQLFLLANLFLNDNLFSGEIPEEIGFTLPNLTELSLAGNFFEGSIPASIQELQVLRWLDLGRNQLSGSIPDMNANQRLRFLYLDNNNLSGDISFQFIAFFALFELDLSGNELTGQIPGFLANSTFLESLWLADNAFEGPIPPEFTTLENLVVLNLWNNNLEGPIPPGIGNLSNLVTLDLGWNNLSGSLPEEMEQLDQLFNLFLDINELSGPVPESFTGAESVSVLILNDNFLTKIPDLTPMAFLDSVSLGNNLLGFDSIEPNLGVAMERITYAPQRPLPLFADELDTTIQFSAAIGGTGNQYQWFLGPTPINGATATTYEAPYASLNSSDDIVLEVISQFVPDLILATEPIRADARLARAVVSPAALTVAPGDSVQFEYFGLDQFNSVRRFSGMWVADGGTIDQTGLYVAGTTPGQYEITVNNTLGIPVGSTIIDISNSVSNEEPENIVQAFALNSNFPNPFRESTELTVAIPEPTHVVLKVYNVLGQEMDTVADRLLQSGTHRFKINAEHWPAGIYFYTFKSEAFIETQTMVKVH